MSVIDTDSNVVQVSGNVSATAYHGDGSHLTGLSRYITTSNTGTVAFTNTSYANVSLVETRITSGASDFTVDGTTGEITVLKAGVYRVTYSIYFYVASASATARNYIQTILQRNGLTFGYMLGSGYQRIVSGDSNSGIVSINNSAVIFLSANDKLQLKARHASKALDSNIDLNKSNLSINLV